MNELMYFFYNQGNFFYNHLQLVIKIVFDFRLSSIYYCILELTLRRFLQHCL